jgi:hypothetical protein
MQVIGVRVSSRRPRKDSRAVQRRVDTLAPLWGVAEVRLLLR